MAEVEALLAEPSEEEVLAPLAAESPEPAFAEPESLGVADPPPASAPATGTAASLVLAAPLPLLRKSVTYQPEPLS